MVDTYILSVEDFKNVADISPNVNTERLKQYLGVTQEKYAVKILCRELYNELLDEIENKTLSPANEALLPYLKDYLIRKTWYRYIQSINLLSTPAGLRTLNSTTDNVATPEQMQPVANLALSDANFYQDELVGFLKCNADDYPLWRDSICGCSDKLTNKNNQFSIVGKSNFGNKPIEWT